MRAGPALPVGVRRPVAALDTLPASPWATADAIPTSWSRDVLTTCCAESRLLRCGRGLAGVGAALCDDLVGGLFVGVAAIGRSDTRVQGVELVAGAEVGVAAGVALQVLPAGRDA